MNRRGAGARALSDSTIASLDVTEPMTWSATD
jgi:hypothetical protein